VFIPDFGFEKNGVKAYLEVVGFWTDEYLQKKLGKLRESTLRTCSLLLIGPQLC